MSGLEKGPLIVEQKAPRNTNLSYRALDPVLARTLKSGFLVGNGLIPGISRVLTPKVTLFGPPWPVGFALKPRTFWAQKGSNRGPSRIASMGPKGPPGPIQWKTTSALIPLVFQYKTSHFGGPKRPNLR